MVENGFVLIAEGALLVERSRPGAGRFSLAAVEVPRGQMHLLETATGHTLCCTEQDASLCCGRGYEQFGGRGLPDRVAGGCARCRATAGVREGGLEPPRPRAPDPKSGASANSATLARGPAGPADSPTVR